MIGSIGLCGRTRENRILDLGYILQRDRWGQGLAVEAARAVLAHGFAATSAERIIAPVFAPNHASRRVAEKLGFRLAQITPAQAGDYANRFDEATYVLTRQDFLRGVDLPHLGRPGH